MGLFKYCAIVAFIAFTAHFAFYPLPPCYDGAPTSLRVVTRVVPFLHGFGFLLENLGIASYVEFIRATMNSERQPDSPGLRTEDASFNNVSVRLYLPAERQPNGAAVFFIHGGAWVFGSLNLYDPLVSRLATSLNVLTVSVDYRLAPEHAYPAAIDDVERAFRFFVQHASEYGVNASRIAVAGDSAGGNLAAALAIRVRDSASSSSAGRRKKAAQAMIKSQILFYPVLQATNFSTASLLINIGKSMTTHSQTVDFYLQYALGMDFYDAKLRDSVRRYLEQGCMRRSRNAKLHAVDKVFKQTQNGKNDDIRERILTDDDRAALERARDDGEARRLIEATCTMSEREAEEVEKRLECLAEASFSPLLVESVEGLPAAYVVSCKPDVLRDDALLYVERLREGGVRVEHVHESNECHGFLSFAPDAGVERLRSFLANNRELL